MLTEGLLLVSVFLIMYAFLQKTNFPPGPRPLPLVGNLLLLKTGNVEETFRDLRSRYGDVFTLKLGTYYTVVANGYVAIRELLVKRGEKTSSRPDNFLSEVLFRAQGIAGSSGTLWKTHRTFAMIALRNLGFGKYRVEENIIEEVTKFLEEIDRKEGKPANLDVLLHASVANTVCAITFGKRFDYNDEKFLRLLELFADVLKVLGAGSIIDYFPSLRHIPGDPFKGKLMLKKIETVRTFMRQLADEHKQTFNENNIRDYTDAFVREMKQNRDTFTDEQLTSCLLEIFLAGSETTSTVLSWAIRFFVIYPEVQNKMTKELDNVVGASRLPSLNDRPNLPYCEAVVTEVLRCADIVPFARVRCNSDVSFNGFTIPKGTIIVANLNSINFDSHIFKNAETFNPERFIDENGKFYGYASIAPFSIGRRLCLGERFARCELFLYITSMVQRFRFLPKDDNILPDIQGILGLTKFPKPYDLRALKRN